MTARRDPVLVQRALIARWVSLGLKVGYGLFALAMVGFFGGLLTQFTQALVTLIVTCLFVGSAVLAPSIVFNYGVKAADRADRGAGR